jgi:nitronate monooxygenase
VGTAFAFCNESGIVPEIKHEVLRQCLNGKLKVLTDFQASPTGYPFKLIKLKNMGTDQEENKERERICDLCYLRHPYCKGDSEIGYRCPGEPISTYLLKGGCQDETIGKQCLCNGLLATIGLGQIREDGCEFPIVTAGEDFSFITALVKNSRLTYSAADVIDYLRK